MTNEDKDLLRKICKISDNKKDAEHRIKLHWLTVSKSTFNKYWRIFGKKELKQDD